MKYNYKIDFLKSLSIIFVVLLHSLSVEERNLIAAPYYMVQAVPIFIIISGYNYTNSYINNKLELKQLYSKQELLKKISRIMYPFLLMYIIENFWSILILNNLEFRKIIKYSFLGGFGPGSYYVPLMIQLILIMPIMYTIAKKNKKLLLLISFFINFIFEVIAYNIHLSNDIYRLLLVRYLFLLGLGIYYSLEEKKQINLYIHITCIFSLIYITLVEYFGYTPIAQQDWRSQNTLSYFYPYFLFVITMQKLPLLNEKLNNILRYISKATYHIYLFQMFYFWSGFSSIIAKLNNKVLIISSNLLICILGGLMFFKVYNKLIHQ